MSTIKPASPIRVWDLPTRLFHWLLAVAFGVAFVTGDSERWRDIHLLAGYTAGALIALRLVWGVVGTRYARFGALELRPRRVLAYLGSLIRGRPEHHVGHNPAGSVAVVALLALLALTALTGLATWNEVGGKQLEDLHEGLANVTLAMVVVHIGGVVVSSVLHRENLVVAMITGIKNGSPSQAIRSVRPIAGALLLALIVGLWAGWLPTPGLGDTSTAAPQVNAAPAPHRDQD